MPLFAFLALMVQPAKAGFDEATAAFAAGDYPKVLAELTPLAKEGDPRSQYAMGLLYENGLGVAIDPAVAATWYLKAAEQGNSDAQYNLGVMFERGVGVPVNHTEAARWYRPALSCSRHRRGSDATRLRVQKVGSGHGAGLGNGHGAYKLELNNPVYQDMLSWMQQNGAPVEARVMAFDPGPTLAALPR
jgi:TPR repeat protein